jgi:C-terminal processing protease CtpA/Prc
LFGHNENNDLLVDKEGNYYTHFKGYKPLNPHKNNFKGKIYVLINGFSFSASSLLSANLKAINRATFIGEETGGGFNQCVAGILPEIQLKNTKLTLRFGLYKMIPNAKQEMYGRGVFPDVEILPSITDKINNVDKELEWILNTSKK